MRAIRRAAGAARDWDVFLDMLTSRSRRVTAKQRPGVDFLFIGPADLSQTMGLPGEWEHPDVWGAVEKVAAACAKNGRRWGILPMGPAHAKRCVAIG